MSNSKTTEQYYERLKFWNSTSKYKNEVEFLKLLLALEANDQVLDFGCGTGYCLEMLKETSPARFWGYDVNLFFNDAIPGWFLKDYRQKKYSKIFMMHSIAHIPDIVSTLENVVNCLEDGGKLVVITPNKDFDDYYRQNVNTGHKRDMTVVGHYTQSSLADIATQVGLNVRNLGQFGDMVNKYNERIFLVAQKKS